MLTNSVSRQRLCLARNEHSGKVVLPEELLSPRHEAPSRAPGARLQVDRILHRCWTDRTPYVASRYLLALQKRQAPRLNFAIDAGPPQGMGWPALGRGV
jgi:hypothetical protein